MKRIKPLLMAVGIAAATLLTSAPANAAPDCEMTVQAPIFGAGILNLRSCDSYDWADWDVDLIPDEIFAVRVDRTVWHAFPGSHGWRLMPGNKTADDMNNSIADGREAWWRTGSTRHLSVWVTGGTGSWCTSGQRGVGWSGVWRDC